MKASRAFLTGLLLLFPCVPAAAQMDSQTVVSQYVHALAKLKTPKNVVFAYTVSQAGVHTIEQTHVIYRSGARERDETLSVNGASLHPPSIRIFSKMDRYNVQRLAPRPAQYVFLLLGTQKVAGHWQYTYSTTPLAASAFTVTEVTIDGESYLPTQIHFRTGGAVAGRGVISFARYAKYWMPSVIVADARIGGKPTEERIAWSGYRFPASLPATTFSSPKALVTPAPAAPF